MRALKIVHSDFKFHVFAEARVLPFGEGEAERMLATFESAVLFSHLLHELIDYLVLAQKLGVLALTISNLSRSLVDDLHHWALFLVGRASLTGVVLLKLILSVLIVVVSKA